MSDRRLQVYETEQVRVTYDPMICRHSGVCLRTLPAVFFDVRQQHWVQPENATTEAIIAAVAKCPSGALHAQLVTSVLPTVKRDGES
ncbi:MAG: (4Fe-4S)-binding protein [Gemmatimonadales bacterium]